jgi:hypothetical protein
MGEVKIVVSYENKQELYSFDQNAPLSTIIEELCDKFRIRSRNRLENYGLKFVDSLQKSEYFVTGENRAEVKNGAFLRLTHSAKKETDTINGILETGSLVERAQILNRLSGLLRDSGFKQEFVKSDIGSIYLIKIITGDKNEGEMLQ